LGNSPGDENSSQRTVIIVPYWPVAFFMKPFDDEKFIAAVRDALNQSLSRK
jgi:hypothetical protein